MIAGVASVGNGADTLHYAYRPGLNRLATATWRNSQNAELNSRTYAYDTYHRLTGINLNNVSEVTYTLSVPPPPMRSAERGATATMRRVR